MAPWDLFCLQELEEGTIEDVSDALGSQGLELVWYAHPGREDAIGVAYKRDIFKLVASSLRPFPPGPDAKAGTVRVDLVHVTSGLGVRVLSTHQRGRNAEQLNDLFDFAEAETPFFGPSAVVVCGDFNEDFGPLESDESKSSLPERLTVLASYSTLDRASPEPLVSRPSHKQDPALNSSGRGKVDYTFCRALQQRTSASSRKDGLGELSTSQEEGIGSAGNAAVSIRLERSEEALRALMDSHRPCEETGEWPSDHGLEALAMQVSW